MNYYEYCQQGSNKCANYISIQRRIQIDETEEDLRDITKA